MQGHHLAIARVVRLLSEVRLAVLALATVSAWAEGQLTAGALLVAVLAVPFSLVPARSWESRGDLFSRSGILLACDLVMSVLAVAFLPGQLMTVYAAASVALLAVVVGTRLALVMALPLALLLVGDLSGAGPARWVVLLTGAIGVVAMAWAGSALGTALRSQDRASRELTVARSRRAATVERVRIARDLHDTVAGDLAGARMLSSTLLDVLAREAPDGRAAVLARQLAETCASAHDRTRAALHQLREAERGPSEDLAGLVQRWSERTGIAADVEVQAVDDVPGPVLHDVRAVLLELLENARKHADARRVVVRLVAEDGEVRLVVTDDGRGMDLEAPVPNGHYGLRGIEERVVVRGGSVQRRTPSGGGLRTEVRLRTAEVPVEAES